MMSFISLFQFGLPMIGQEIPESFAVDSVLLWSFKALFIVLSILFSIFSFVVIRQIKVMNETVTTGLGPMLQILSYVVFAFSIVLIIAAFTQL